MGIELWCTSALDRDAAARLPRGASSRDCSSPGCRCRYSNTARSASESMLSDPAACRLECSDDDTT